MRYNVPVWNSIFAGVLSPLPFSFAPLAPTINLFGILLGNDKTGHLFQQGHEYYIIKRTASLPESRTSKSARTPSPSASGRNVEGTALRWTVFFPTQTSLPTTPE